MGEIWRLRCCSFCTIPETNLHNEASPPQGRQELSLGQRQQIADGISLLYTPGAQHVFPDGQAAFVQFMPAYRHLGTLYTSDQKLEAEISSRIGAAIPCQLRLQLFGPLILSKFYFSLLLAYPYRSAAGSIAGCCSANGEENLRGYHGHSGISAAQIAVDTSSPEPRVRLAMDRLLYARRLFHHASEIISNSFLACGIAA